jgi:hypothetical protein
MNRYGLIFGQSNLGSVCREPLSLSAAGGLAAYRVSEARLNLPIGRRVAGSWLARDKQRAQISTETKGHWDVGLSLFGANG